MPKPQLTEKQATAVVSRGEGAALAITLAVVLLIGIQLGGVPWRYRKQLWQLQGVCLGAVVGYVVGRFSAGKS